MAIFKYVSIKRLPRKDAISEVSTIYCLHPWPPSNPIPTDSRAERAAAIPIPAHIIVGFLQRQFRCSTCLIATGMSKCQGQCHRDGSLPAAWSWHCRMEHGTQNEAPRTMDDPTMVTMMMTTPPAAAKSFASQATAVKYAVRHLNFA